MKTKNKAKQPDPTKCLICTVYAEARGTDSSCQYGVATVILNRLAEARARGTKPVTICDIVSKPGAFDAYKNDNYKNCVKCKIPKNDQPDYDDTLDNFSQPFDMLDDAMYFANNTDAMKTYFENKLHKIPVPNKPCVDLIFYAEPGTK